MYDTKKVKIHSTSEAIIQFRKLWGSANMLLMKLLLVLQFNKAWVEVCESAHYSKTRR